MKNIAIFLSLSLIIQTNLIKGQHIYSGNLYLTSQNEVNALDTLIHGISIIEGSVYIGSSNENENPITDLSPLIHIQKITEDLFIGGYYNGHVFSNSNLKTLNGLDSIQSIGRKLVISSNHKLDSLQGLGALISIGIELEIRDNSCLKSFEGIGSVNRISALYISNNDSIIDLKGLEKLTYLEGCSIYENKQLYSFQGLNNVTFIGGFTVQDNLNLKDFTGLDNLRTIEYLNVARNKAMLTFYGLQNLRKIILELYINDNPTLLTLHGLQNSKPSNEFGYGIFILNNQSLYDFCAISNLVENANDLNLNISNNAFNPIFEMGKCKPSDIVYTGSLNLTSQIEVDKVPTLITDKTIILGSIFIGSKANEENPITNLEGLSSIKKIFGSLIIGGYYNNNMGYNPNLYNLKGFYSLDTIMGNLLIQKNDVLTNLTGLESLLYVKNELKIEDNQALISLKGLDSLKENDWNISISRNNRLDSLNLNSLTTCEYLYIENNSNLTYLNGLNNLTNVNQIISFERNNSLLSLKGLEALQTINGGLDIDNNLKLITLEGLENLKTCNGLILNNSNITTLGHLKSLNKSYSIILSNNSNLENIHGLEKISYLEGSLEIVNNNKLKSLESLKNLKGIEYNIYISQNDSLEMLEGLNNLSNTCHGQVAITNNTSLKNLCALTQLFNVGTNGASISGNKFNPTMAQVKFGQCGYYNINFSSSENGTIEGVCKQEVFSGENSIPITAIANENYKFDKWINDLGDSISNENPLVILNVNNNVNMTCMFKLIDNIKNKNLNYQFFPNPTTGILQINNQIPTTVSILDLNGKTLKQKHYSPGSKQLDISNFNSGIYFITFESEKGTSTHKLLIQ